MPMYRNVLSLIVILGSILQSECSASSEERPNVLLICVDDLRPELGCYGNDHIITPHMDSLAEKSFLFTRAYCQQAVCNPSRVSFLTGLRPDSTKVWDLVTGFRDVLPDVTTLPQQFKQNGYRTLGYGKIFHNPWPDNVSWSEPHQWPRNTKLWSEKAKEGLAQFQEKLRQQGIPDNSVNRLRAQATEVVDYPENKHIDAAIADQSIAALRRLAKQDQPFFLGTGFIRPHLPFVVPRKYWDLYDREQISLAENHFPPRGAPAFAMNTMYELRDYYNFLETPRPSEDALSEAQQRALKHGYFAAVSFIDAQIGKLIAELERLQLRENTIIVLWGDHGWKLGEHRSWCKQTNYEIDTRVPLLIHVPEPFLQKTTNKGRIDTVVESLDVYPTLCQLAGLPIPMHLEGQSLVPLLEQPTTSWGNRAVSQFSRRDGKHERMGYALRTDRYRYIEWLARNTCQTVAKELYDHEVDPLENQNISEDPDYKEILSTQATILWETINRPQPGDLAKPAMTRVKEKKARPVMRFNNQSKELVELFWLAPDGRKVSQGDIKPGETRSVNTTRGHRFQIDNENEIYTVSKKNETILLELLPEMLSNQTVDKRPNILVLMGDDWSWPHAGFLGDPVVKTPTFDRLAKNGVVFEHAFVSSPSCTPSRFAIATGQYHWRLGDGANLGGSLQADVPVYPDLLSDVGYHVGFSRKGAAPSQHVHRRSDPFGLKFKNFAQFLESRTKNQPFCFWYGAGEPHRPYRFGSGERKGLNPDKVKLPEYLPDHDIVRSDMCDYFADIQRFDKDCGVMLEVLEETGELENTLIVLSGDNGMPFSSLQSDSLRLRDTRPPRASLAKKIQRWSLDQ